MKNTFDEDAEIDNSTICRKGEIELKRKWLDEAFFIVGTSLIIKLCFLLQKIVSFNVSQEQKQCFIFGGAYVLNLLL